MVEFEWDTTKAVSNRKKHGVSFEEAKSVFYDEFAIQFFDDESCLQGWDGTGTLRESDWPHWLCRITVDTDSRGELYARTFKLAVDGSTGMERTDVLRQ